MSTANMQVITSIYLNCRPDLRDEWLTGIEVDDIADSQVRDWPQRLISISDSIPGSRTSSPSFGKILYVIKQCFVSDLDLIWVQTIPNAMASRVHTRRMRCIVVRAAYRHISRDYILDRSSPVSFVLRARRTPSMQMCSLLYEHTRPIHLSSCHM